MRKRSLILAAASAVVILENSVIATVAINGSYDADYGSALSLQTNNTGFGDNTQNNGNTANGSELDGGYGLVQNGFLYLFLTGNVETNNNHLNIFIANSASSSGQNIINCQNVG